MFVPFTSTDIVSREPMFVKGNQNDGMFRVRFADGSEGVEKHMKDWHGNKTGRLYRAEILAAQEYLAARVGEAMNAPVRDCRFVGTDAKMVIMPYIDGKSGLELGSEDCYPNDNQGRSLRLFDYITANADRRPKNLMFAQGGIVGIDHALCNFRVREATPEVATALWNAGLTLETLAGLRPRLEALQDEFHQLGMDDKYAQMIDNLNRLIDVFQTLAAHFAVKKDTFTPPQGVQEAAKRALEWIADGKAGSGFTNVGRKRASDLGNGHQISLDTLKRMKAYFDRHQPDKKAEGFRQGEHGYPSHGRVAWDAWGGDAGYSWAKSMVERHVQKGDVQGHVFHGNQWETTDASGVTVYRGVRSSQAVSDTLSGKKEIGLDGKAVYATDSEEVARAYAGEGGTVLRGKLRDGAKLFTSGLTNEEDGKTANVDGKMTLVSQQDISQPKDHTNYSIWNPDAVVWESPVQKGDVSKTAGEIWAKYALLPFQKATKPKEEHLSDKAAKLLAQEQEAHEAGDDDKASQLHYQVLNEVYK